jgi:hypothetical protein
MESPYGNYQDFFTKEESNETFYKDTKGREWEISFENEFFRATCENGRDVGGNTHDEKEIVEEIEYMVAHDVSYWIRENFSFEGE